MAHQFRKMSEIMKEMSAQVLRQPDGIPSSEAAHIALMFANIAWNESVGLGQPRTSYRAGWEGIEAENPEMWSEFKSNDVDAMIDELVQFKKQHHADDLRRVLGCGIPDGRIRVEWLPPAASGVDSRWEMRLYGLVRTGDQKKAIQYLCETRRMSEQEAARRVAEIMADLGMG